MKSIMFAAIGAVALAAVSPAWADEREVAGAQKSVMELLDEFLKLKFGMFIHYNMATHKNVEWVEGFRFANRRPVPVECQTHGAKIAV